MSDFSPRGIEEFMQRNLESVHETTNVADAAVRMTDKRIGCLIIQSKRQDSDQAPIVGMVSETDIVRKVMADDNVDSTTPVAQIMSNSLRTIASSRSMLDASHVMEQHGVRHLCVSKGEEIVGLISTRDLVRYFVEADSGPIQELDNVFRPLSVLMQTAIETIDSDTPVRRAAQQMAEKQIGALLVKHDGEMQGIVTERDLIQKVLSQEADANSLTVKEVMNQPLISIGINRTVHDANDLMAEQWIRHLPVTENRKIVGILSIRDLIRMIALRDRPRFLRQQ